VDETDGKSRGASVYAAWRLALAQWAASAYASHEKHAALTVADPRYRVAATDASAMLAPVEA
jgi:hypothetical protein